MSAKPRGPAKAKREDILETATGLFCKDGFQATGVDAIWKAAGVAKMTLYHHFPTKNDLILETLRTLEQKHFAMYVDALERGATDPRERLFNIFEPLDFVFASDRFFGCPFIKASHEFPDLSDPAHALALSYKEKFVRYFERLAIEAGVKSPERFARQAQLLFEGAMILFQLRRDRAILDDARAALVWLASEG